jgi:hypothetical protein
MSRHYKALKIIKFKGLDKGVLFFLALGLALICLPGWAQDEEVEEEFKGVGIHLRLRGAWTMFSGGDLKKGTSGMYDQGAADLIDSGFAVVSSDKESLDSGYEITGDLVYYLSPKFGLGIGGGWLRARRESIFRFSVPGSLLNYTMVSAPKLGVTSIRLGVFYALPLNRLLTVYLNAGPAYYFVSFQYGGNIVTPADQDSILQDVRARSLGFEGGVGLEIRMNQRLAFIIEAQGRYAKVSGFEGKESIYRVIGGPVFSAVENGTLFYVEGDGFQRLDIFPGGPPAGVIAKEAELDLTGVSLQAGLNFKF